MAILAVHVKVSEAAAFLTKNKTLQLIWDQFSWQLTTILWAAHFKLRLPKSISKTPWGSDRPLYVHFGHTHQKRKLKRTAASLIIETSIQTFIISFYSSSRRFCELPTSKCGWFFTALMRKAVTAPLRNRLALRTSIERRQTSSNSSQNNSQRFQNYLNSWALLASAGHLRWFQSLARSRWRLPLILCWTLLVPIVVSDARNVRTNARALTISLVHYQ